MRAILAIANGIGFRFAAGKVVMLKVATLSLILLLSSAARAASPLPRVVVLDVLQLTPGLERVNTRQRITDAVTATAKEHGWEPVSGAIECHDLTCAGLLASSAKANYVLVLLGAFSLTEFYASDVGVSLWRDGGVIASRSETDEKADFDKGGGGTFLSCGPPTGTCTAPLVTSKLIQYAGKVLDHEAEAIRDRATTLEAAAPAPAVAIGPAAPLIPAAAVTQDADGVGRILGWSLVGSGAVLVGGGIALWAFNNSGTDCHSAAGGPSECRQYHHTSTAAALVGGAGLVAAAGGIVILVTDTGPARVALSANPSGLSLGGTF